MKNALLAIIISLLLVYTFGNLFSDWWGIHLMMDNHMMSPFESFAAVAVVGVVFTVIGLIVAFSLVGALALAAFAVVASIILAGVTAFWPIVVIVLAVWLLRRKNEPHTV